MAIKMDYSFLCARMRSLVQGVPYVTANLANTSALLYQQLEDVNWAGFYFMKDGKLILGPFQGKPACIEIEPGCGVCGSAAQLDRILTVPDVHAFEGHIACDSASKSEIVIPLHKEGRVVGVLDIDSPIAGRFTQEDEAGLREAAEIIEEFL